MENTKCWVPVGWRLQASDPSDELSAIRSHEMMGQPKTVSQYSVKKQLWQLTWQQVLGGQNDNIWRQLTKNMRVLSSVKHVTGFIILNYDIRNEMGYFIWHPHTKKLAKR